MTYYGGKELAASFRTVRANTVQIARDIPDTQYGFQPAPDTRSVARLLAHIAFLPGMALEIHSKRLDDMKKVDFPAVIQRLTTEEAKPRSKDELIAVLQAEGEIFAEFLAGVSDAFLAERVATPPGSPEPSKSRFELLLSPKEHEMHHRGQLMLIQRMLGIVPHLTRQMQERFARVQGQQAGR